MKFLGFPFFIFLLHSLLAMMEELIVYPFEFQAKWKRSTYNSIESIESYINMITTYNSILTKKECAIFKKTEILKCKKAIVNKDKSKKDGKLEISCHHYTCVCMWI